MMFYVFWVDVSFNKNYNGLLITAIYITLFTVIKWANSQSAYMVCLQKSLFVL